MLISFLSHGLYGCVMTTGRGNGTPNNNQLLLLCHLYICHNAHILRLKLVIHHPG